MIYHSVGCTLKDKPKSKLFYSQEVPQLGGRSALIGDLIKGGSNEVIRQEGNGVKAVRPVELALHGEGRKLALTALVALAVSRHHFAGDAVRRLKCFG